MSRAKMLFGTQHVSEMVFTITIRALNLGWQNCYVLCNPTHFRLIEYGPIFKCLIGKCANELCNNCGTHCHLFGRR